MLPAVGLEDLLMIPRKLAGLLGFPEGSGAGLRVVYNSMHMSVNVRGRHPNSQD